MQSTSFIKMIGLAGFASLIMALEGIILLPILTKTLGLHLFGVWTLVNATISLLAPLATLGLGISAVRLLAGKTNKEEISSEFFSVLVVVLFTGTIIAITVASISNYLLPIFKNSGDAYYFSISSFMIILWAARSLLLVYFQTFRQMSKYATYTILYVLCETVFAGYFALSGYGLTGVIFGVIAANSIVVSLILANIVNKIGFHGFRFFKMKEYFSIGLPYIPAMLFWWILSSSDKFFIGIFMDASIVGIYSTAYAMASLLMIFISAILFALNPTVSKLWDHGEIVEVKQHFSRSLRYSMLLTIPSAFGISVLGENILKILTTPEFVPGAKIIPFLCIGMIAFGIFSLLTSVLILARKTIFTTHAAGIAAVSNIILNITLIPRFGIWGAAIAAMSAYLLMMLFEFYFSRKYLVFDINMQFIIKSVIASIIMSLVVMQLHPAGISQLITTVVIGAAIYGIIIVLIGGVTKTELTFYWNAGLGLLGMK